MNRLYVKIVLMFSILVTFIGCGSSESESITITDPNSKYAMAYEGLTFYYENKSPAEYRLNQLTNSEFNALRELQKLQVANNLLNTLFFGYPQSELEEKIASGDFITEVRAGLEKESIDRGELESYILDDDIFTQYSEWAQPQAITILTRFYAMDTLDSYFFKNWIAYILTQTIMFSPAYELSTSHTPDISGVYNRVVTMLDDEAGMRFITYAHMMSENNWRRFRSPEDNGREMLEIFLFDMDDTHVPIAAKALQNWKLNTEHDTLEVSLNQNTTPLNLFGTTIYNGDDFYRELAKSDLFTQGVTKRLVDFFFPEKTQTLKQQIVNSIVSSKPETWQDILLQIVFSEEYLLHNTRAKSAEETFFSLAKKMQFKHRDSTFYAFKRDLEDMHQASMKYKLGKLERVPLDTLSFAHYHKYIRERILLDRSDPEYIYDYTAWARDGWSDSFIAYDNFDYDGANHTKSLESLVNYIFKTIVSREATQGELDLFKEFMIHERDAELLLRYPFNMFLSNDDPQAQIDNRERAKRYIAFIVLEYISRLDASYRQREVQ